jgi:phage-related protein
MANGINLGIFSKFNDKGVNDAMSGLKKFGAVAGVAAAAVGAVGAAWVISSAKQLMEIEKLNAQTNAAIASTGSAAERSISQINGLNQSLEKLTGIEAEVIQEGQNMLLTFTNIKGTQFDEATKAALNLSVALGKDMQSSAMLVGKALNDPIGGISALSRAGIQFSEEQKGTIASLVELGDVAGAQTIILAELEKQFGGSAAAFGETTAGQLEKVKNSFGNLGESVAASLLPILNSVLPQIITFLDGLLVDPMFIEFQKEMALAFQQIANALLPLLPLFMNLITTILPPLAQLISLLLPPFVELLNAILVPLIPIINTLVAAFVPLLQAILPPLMRVVQLLVPVVMSLLKAFMPFIEILLPVLIEYFFLLLSPLLELLERVLPFLPPLIDGLAKAFKWMFDNVLKPLIEGVKALVGFFQQLFGFSGKSIDIKASVPAGTAVRGRGVQLAEGGIVPARMGGTLATIGEGGQAEAVIPLDRFDDIVGKRGGGGIVINVNAGMGTDGAAVGEQIVNAIRRYERTSGAVFARA